MISLFFDTETSGLPLWKESYKHPDQPWIVQFAGILADENMIYHKVSFLIDANGRKIEPRAQATHGFSEKDTKFGYPDLEAINIIYHLLRHAEQIVCHNVKFDKKLVQTLAFNCGLQLMCDGLDRLQSYCTMEKSTEYCRLLPKRWGKYKWPKLTELYQILFDTDLIDSHDALVDVEATMKCYKKLKELGV